MHNPRGCWRECAAAALALFCAIGLNVNAFSVYTPYLTQALELSYSQSSNFLMVRGVVSVVAMFFVKWYYEKLEIRWGYTLALLMSAVSVLLYANARSFTGLCIAAAVSGFAYGLGGMYPAAILIHRWFPSHEGLALGICAASTGIAITVGAPILTALTETYSMISAMYCEIGFLLVCTVVCLFLIQNFPRGAAPQKSEQRAKRQPMKLSWMFFAAVAVGVLGGCFSYLTMHYTVEGFDPYQISMIVSAVGLILTVGKFILGELLDFWGAIRTNWLFLSMAVLGCALFCIGGTAGYMPVLAAACMYGFGNSVSTVGLTAYAKDLSTPEEYASTQQQYQTAYLLGNLICSPLSGIVADVTNSYRGFYVITTLLMVFAMAVIQGSYIKQRRSIKTNG